MKCDKVLLITDHVGYGRVAMMQMHSALSILGKQVYSLPTACVSNILSLPGGHTTVLTEHMRETLLAYDSQGLSFETLYTGFLCSAEQIEIVYEYCVRHPQTKLIVDPVMGDYGKLYNGITKDKIKKLRKLISIADIIVPNQTEGCFLADAYQDKTCLTPEQALKLADRLHQIGARDVVITGMTLEGKACTMYYEGAIKEPSFFPYREISVRVPGAGDTFAALFMGYEGAGSSRKEALQKAVSVMEMLVEKEQKTIADNIGIRLEPYADLIQKTM